MAGSNVRDLCRQGPWRHHDLSANGARFHVALGEHFAPDRPLVLLLHGFAQFWWAWRHQIPPLDAAGYAVAALDLRGHGASDKTPSGYDPATVAADVSGVVRSLGYDAAVLVGHDAGGTAAWATAAYAPAQVQALAAVSAAHPSHPASDWLSRLGLLLPGVAERVIMADGARWVEQRLRARAIDQGFLTPADAQLYREALRRWPSPRCALGPVRAATRERWLSRGRDYHRRLGVGVDVPLLLLRGRADPVLIRADLDRAAGHGRQRIDLVELDGVGHQAPEEDPDGVTAALVGWLGTL